MSHNTQAISLMDQQQVHKLYADGYNQKYIAKVLNISLRSVRNILSKPLEEIESSINCAEYFYSQLDDGNYASVSFECPDGNHVNYESPLSADSDPTFDSVAAWEELEQQQED